MMRSGAANRSCFTTKQMFKAKSLFELIKKRLQCSSPVLTYMYMMWFASTNENKENFYFVVRKILRKVNVRQLI